MHVVFICGPYRAETLYGIIMNIRTAERYAAKYWKYGYAVLCPHKNSAAMDGLVPDRMFLKGVREFVRRSDIIVCLPGWDTSAGSLQEHALAKRLGKAIIYEELL